MVEPTSIASAVFSGLNALLIIIKQSAHLAQVNTEVSQLQINVRIADNAVRTARRLVRLNAAALDAHLCADVDRSIEAVEKILTLLRDKVEACRRDLETRGTVGWRNRTAWLGWRKEEFAGMLATLTNTMGGLNRDIGRMETCIRLSAATGNFTAPSRYGAKSLHEDEDDDEEVWKHHSFFPRSPTMRRGLATHRTEAIAPTSIASLMAYGSTTTLVDDTTSNSSWVADVEDIIRAVGTNAQVTPPAMPLVPPPAPPRLLHVHSAPSQVSLARSVAVTEASEGEQEYVHAASIAYNPKIGRHSAATTSSVRWEEPVSNDGRSEVSANGQESAAAKDHFELEVDALNDLGDKFSLPRPRNRRRRSNFI